MTSPNSPIELILITGVSGSGKSVALHALEDARYFCVDNLPPELLIDFVDLETQKGSTKLAIAMDSRSAESLPLIPEQIAKLKKANVDVRLLFLDTQTSTLIRRFSESRRPHPLSKPNASHADIERDLQQSIDLERELLCDLRELSHIIDTSLLRNSQLQSHIKNLVFAPEAQLTLIFESFAFKKGIPVHADYVFDVRMLPNPHYEPELKALTGLDEPVASWLGQEPLVGKMTNHIEEFLSQWLQALNSDHRSYVTVAIGCTGGQHRSVFLVEQLTQRFSQKWVTLKRHRELGL
jgi:UPF0042 nucleotide-binding protein